MELDNYLKFDRATIDATNLCDRFSEEDLQKIGEEVYEGFSHDLNSRSAWEERTQAAMDLAMQVVKTKTFPWPNAANVAFPLVTIAALQFHSRAYPQIVQGPNIVKMRVEGEDVTKEMLDSARRVGRHMSYQLLEKDTGWEEGQDRLLLVLPIMGCVFKKTYYSSQRKMNISEMIMPQDLVVNYWARSIEDCFRKTHVIPLHRNIVHERSVRGLFVDVTQESWFQESARTPDLPAQNRADVRKGSNPPQADHETPFEFLEQHCFRDFDGDGYQEPYIITIEKSSRKVVRIVARCDSENAVDRVGGRIAAITATEYFTKYSFIPAPDGGIYDLGFGVLLGPINEAVSTAINQLIDAGTMVTAGGGFLGKGVKVRGGSYTFSPNEWKRVDSTGDDLRKNIFPLPVGEPSAVLFNLLSLLISYTNRIAGTTDTLVGESVGQNTPAETSREMVTQGMKVFSAIFKRVWRAQKGEFKKLYLMNGQRMGGGRVTFGEGNWISPDDYKGNPDLIIPEADPNIVSDEMKMNQAMTVKAAAGTTPGYDPVEVEKMFLRANKIEGIDIIYPGPEKMPPGKDLKLQLKEMDVQLAQAKMQNENYRFAAQLQSDALVNEAKVRMLEAQATKLLADADGMATEQQIQAINAAIGAMKHQNEVIRGHADRLMQGIQSDRDHERGMAELDLARRDQDLQASAASASSSSAS